MGPVVAARGPSVLDGGELGRTLTEFLDEHTEEGKRTSGLVDDLADECRDRAEATRDAEKEQRKYEKKLAEYNEFKERLAAELGVPADELEEPLLGFFGPPEKPDPPPPWAEF